MDSIPSVEGKACQGCGVWFPLLAYTLNRAAPDGRDRLCRPCKQHQKALSRQRAAQRARTCVITQLRALIGVPAESVRGPGVYALTHMPSGRSYIGSSIAVAQRVLDHTARLERGVHRCKSLQRDWLLAGPAAFSACCLEVVAESNLLAAAEQRWLDATPLRYNRRAAAFRGRKLIPKSVVVRRFWAKVSKTETCWLWTAGRSAKGYGTFWAGEGGYMTAHRYSYLLAHGSIPQGRLIHHLCHTRHCVNPDHLVAATPKENTADIIARGIPFLPIPRRGEKASGAKLCADEVRAIRARYVAGETKAALARAYRVDPS